MSLSEIFHKVQCDSFDVCDAKGVTNSNTVKPHGSKNPKKRKFSPKMNRQYSVIVLMFVMGSG